MYSKSEAEELTEVAAVARFELAYEHRVSYRRGLKDVIDLSKVVQLLLAPWLRATRYGSHPSTVDIIN
jgi:hypothetical protein